MTAAIMQDYKTIENFLLVNRFKYFTSNLIIDKSNSFNELHDSFKYYIFKSFI